MGQPRCPSAASRSNSHRRWPGWPATCHFGAQAECRRTWTPKAGYFRAETPTSTSTQQVSAADSRPSGSTPVAAETLPCSNSVQNSPPPSSPTCSACTLSPPTNGPATLAPVGTATFRLTYPGRQRMSDSRCPGPCRPAGSPGAHFRPTAVDRHVAACLVGTASVKPLGQKTMMAGA